MTECDCHRVIGPGSAGRCPVCGASSYFHSEEDCKQMMKYHKKNAEKLQEIIDFHKKQKNKNVPKKTHEPLKYHTHKKVVSYKNCVIRTRKTEEGMLTVRPWNVDIAHIWIDDKMFRITNKGTIIEVVRG